VSGKSKQGGKKPRRLTIGIYLDDDVADAADVAEQAYEKVRLELERTRHRRLAEYSAAGFLPDEALAKVHTEDDDGLEVLAVDLDSARAALDAATTWFVFEAIGHRRLTALVARHPATDEQKTTAEARGQALEWNPDTFLRALVEDSCAAPADFWWDDVFGPVPADGVDGFDGEGDLPPKSSWSHADVEALCATALAANQSLRTADVARRPPIRALTGG
jgi:hypothetical protein